MAEQTSAGRRGVTMPAQGRASARGGGDGNIVLRIDFGPRGAIGPGKIRLLEEIDRTGSISAAGRELEMSYRRSWLLVDDLNRCFREPLVASQRGGSRGGGAGLTDFGREVIRRFRAVELAAAGAARGDMSALVDMLAPAAEA